MKSLRLKKSFLVKGAGFLALSLAATSVYAAIGTLDDRSADTNYKVEGTWGVYELTARARSDRPGDTTAVRIEHRLPQVTRRNNARRTFEAEYYISSSSETVIAQVHGSPRGDNHGNVILIYASEHTSAGGQPQWRIYNDIYSPVDGSRTEQKLLATIARPGGLTLKLDTGFNADSSQSNTKIWVNGVFKGTTKHYFRGDAVTIRYGAYRAQSKNVRILVRKEASRTSG